MRLAVVSAELPVPLAPMEVLPLVLGGLAAVEPLLVLGGVAELEPPLVLGLAPVEPPLELVSAPGVGVPDEPVAAPAPVPVPPPEGEAAPELPEVVPPVEPEVWAIESPLNARATAAAAAAAKVVRVFLVVVIAISLNGTPKGFG